MKGGAGWALAWALVALGAAAAAPLLTDLWRLPDHAHGFLMAAVAAVAAWRARADFRRQPRRPASLGLALVGCGAALYTIAFYLSLTFGPRQSVVWLLGVTVLLTAIGLLVAGEGVSRAWAFRHAILFLVLALPIPGTLGSSFQSGLRALAISASEWSLAGLGMPATRDGFVLTLPAGPLLIAEACSGLRSLTSLVAIAFVVAWMHGGGLTLGGALALVAAPVALALNIVRIVATGWLREVFGDVAVEGGAHEAFGAALFVAGPCLLWLAAGWLKGSRPAGPDLASLPQPVPGQGAAVGNGLAAAVLLAAGLIACTEIAAWPEPVLPPLFPAVPARLADFEGEDVLPAADFRSLRSDQELSRLYRDDRGRMIRLWIGYWASDLRQGPHDLDVCLSLRGWSKTTGASRVIRAANGGPAVDVALRSYRRRNQERSDLFWGQQGRVMLSPRPGLFEIENVARVLASPPHTTARLHVYMTLLNPEPREGHDILARFAAALLGPLYDLCPWAEPAR